jgi:oligopeptidase A
MGNAGFDLLLNVPLEIPFDQFRVDQIVPAMQQLVADASARVELIANDREQRTYENTLAALDDALFPLERAVALVRNLEAFVVSPALMAAWEEAQPAVTTFLSGIWMHQGLWDAVRQLEDHKATLTPLELRRLQRALSQFRRNGAELSEESRQRLIAIDVELNQQCLTFNRHVLEATNHFELLITNETELAGLPDSARTAARLNAQAAGHASAWRFTLHAPSLEAVLRYMDHRGHRQTMWEQHHARAAESNDAVIRQMVALRRERARLLGYWNFADYVLEERMAGRGVVAREFLLELLQEVKDSFERENDALQQHWETLGFRDRLQGWDLAWCAEKLRRHLHDIDEELVRGWFPLPQVLDGLFAIVRQLFHVQVKPTPELSVWHQDVLAYQLFEADSEKLLGIFYLDLFPRHDKRQGGWMDTLRTGPPHVGLICANLNPPLPGQPALLTKREVEVLFHEMGHLLHLCLSQVPLRSLAGTNVAWDFVELPSQMMENFTWREEGLALIARHHQSGQPLPSDLLNALLGARRFRAANTLVRHIAFGLVDLDLHIDLDPKLDLDLRSWIREILAPLSPAPLPESYAPIHSLSHLFAEPVGYAAGFYSYKWAEVLEADAFRRFEEEGILNPAVGMEFRRTILALGDSIDAAELFRRFRGRDADRKALLERLGVL